MKKALYLLVSLTTSIIAIAGDIIPSCGYDINDRFETKKIMGRDCWFFPGYLKSSEEAQAIFQLGHLERLALWGEPTIERAAKTGKGYCAGNPLAKLLYERFNDKKIPAIGPIYTWHEDKWENDRIVLKENSPACEYLEETAKKDNFLGWIAYNEWSTAFGWFMSYNTKEKVDGITVPIEKAGAVLGLQMFKNWELPPKSRKDFEEAACYSWKCVNNTYNYNTSLMVGSKLWAFHWGAMWQCKSIIMENRTPGANNVLAQSLARGAARMSGKPWGYLPATDWYSTMAPMIGSVIPDMKRQGTRGWQYLNASLCRRLWYYNVMGNPTLLLDEAASYRYIDMENDGTYKLTWYGEICQEIFDFADTFKNRGISYTPVRIVMGWLNGTSPRGSKAFGLFDYTPGEHMTRELLNRVIFPTKEDEETEANMFGPTPYGDLYDLLRIGAPQGPLPLELLENYKILFCTGELYLTMPEKKRLEEYVTQGGVLVINTEQAKGHFNSFFLGAEISDENKEADSMKCILDGKELKSGKFTYSPLKPLKDTAIIYEIKGAPVVTRSGCGKGFVIAVGAHWMLENMITEKTYRGKIYDTRRTILPLAGDILERFTKSLIPLQLEGENIKDRILYSLNRKGKGWVVSVYNNSGRITQGVKGPELIDITKNTTVKLLINDPVIKYAVEWLSREIEPITESSKKRFIEMELVPGDFKIFELRPDEIPPIEIERKVNFALNKITTSSSSTVNNPPRLAVDGKTDIHYGWRSKSTCPQWIMVDLSREEDINAVKVITAWSENNIYCNRTYQYTVSVSMDSKSWTTVIDESENIQPASKSGLYRRFAPVKARYVKLDVTLNSYMQGAQVVELAVYGDKIEKEQLPWMQNPGKLKMPLEIEMLKKEIYLSDMKPESWKQGWKELTMDAECFRCNKIKIRGTTFEKGLGTHANSEIIYRLNPADGWKYFTAYAGIDDIAADSPGTVKFMVYVDGKLVYQTDTVTSRFRAIPVWANIEGAKELKLVVNDSDDGVEGDIADWADANIRK